MVNKMFYKFEPFDVKFLIILSSQKTKTFYNSLLFIISKNKNFLYDNDKIIIHIFNYIG